MCNNVPTSNHNWRWWSLFSERLYIIMFLHQTTTYTCITIHTTTLYIIMFLHQTTTPKGYAFPPPTLYIIMFLHQTTTSKEQMLQLCCCILSCSYIKPQRLVYYRQGSWGCILSCSYIKPQPGRAQMCSRGVVYYHVPTSNHNWEHSSI